MQAKHKEVIQERFTTMVQHYLAPYLGGLKAGLRIVSILALVLGRLGATSGYTKATTFLFREALGFRVEPILVEIVLG